MKTKKTISTKEIVIAAMLSALSLLYIRLMYTVPIPPWSFTPFSHVPLMLGILISPFVGIMTCIGTFFGFVWKGSDPIILLRAGSHIFFTLLMIIMLRWGRYKSAGKLIALNCIVAVVHAAAEVLAVLVASWAGISVPADRLGAYYLLLVVGVGTMGHSTLDFFVAYMFTKVLRRAHFFIEGYGEGKGV